MDPLYKPPLPLVSNPLFFWDDVAQRAAAAMLHGESQAAVREAQPGGDQERCFKCLRIRSSCQYVILVFVLFVFFKTNIASWG